MARSARGKAAVLGGCLAFALLAAGNGLDRASASHPALAKFVPGLLAAEAHRAVAARSLDGGDNALAIARSELAVRADPIDPRSTALLGAAHLAARQAVRADQAFRVAARFGWRDPLTQLYFMTAALNAGQPRLAALRLDAVLRQAPNFPVRDMLLAQFEASAAGRAALAERLALRPAWTSQFLGDGNSLPLAALQSRAAIVATVPGPKWGCDTVAPLVTRLVISGGAAAARQLWQGQCPDATSTIADPHFAALLRGREPVAFEWNLIGSGDVSASQTQPPGSGLLVRLSGPSAQPVAWQMLTLAPGRYRLTWTAASPDGTQASGAFLSLACAIQERLPVAAQAADGKGRFEASVTVDGRCPAQFLTLWLVPGGAELRFDDPAIVRLP